MNQTPDELLFLQEVVVCLSEVIILNYLQNVLFLHVFFFFCCFTSTIVLSISLINVCVLNFYFLIPLRCYISSISLLTMKRDRVVFLFKNQRRSIICLRWLNFCKLYPTSVRVAASGTSSRTTRPCSSCYCCSPTTTPIMVDLSERIRRWRRRLSWADHFRCCRRWRRRRRRRRVGHLVQLRRGLVQGAIVGHVAGSGC